MKSEVPVIIGYVQGIYFDKLLWELLYGNLIFLY